MSEKKGISLLDLQKELKNKIIQAFPRSIWVKAEVSSVTTNFSGHCYLDLVDKDANGEKLEAKARGIIWSRVWRTLRPYFHETTGEDLKIGMKILIKVQVNYSELYGMSLIINDIEPSFTIGEVEQNRLRTIKRLKDEGMFDMNTSIELPTLPFKIALISSETAAGYGDFINHLDNNEYGFKFTTTLFPSPMQGDATSEGVIRALDAINSGQYGEFDVVLLFRGGGSMTDLACFDDYEMCANIAQFPLPVFSAIGHERDYHVCDMVARVSVKTPTALADFIIDAYAQEDARLDNLANRLEMSLQNKFQRERSEFDKIMIKLDHLFKERMQKEYSRISLLEQRLKSSNPLELIKKGYSLVYSENKKLDSVSQVEIGDPVKVLLSDGDIDCEVKRVNKKKNNG